MKITPVTIATQKPNTKTSGMFIRLPVAVFRGRCIRPTIVIMPIAQMAKKRVDRVGSTVAAMVTGAKMSNANGLLSPPVKAKSKDS
ncbi:Uncharacterised protein [marine metagenome]